MSSEWKDRMKNGTGGSGRFYDAVVVDRVSIPPRFSRPSLLELDADAGEQGLSIPIAWENR